MPFRNDSVQIKINSADDDSEWIINGPGVDKDKIILAKPGAKGIHAAPVSTTYKSSAFQKGGTYQGKRVLKRDITFGCHLYGATPDEWETRYSDWCNAWVYEKDPWNPLAKLTKMTVTTEQSSRWLWLAKQQNAEPEWAVDPHVLNKAMVPLSVVAAQPFWEEPTLMEFFQTGSSGTSTGFIPVSNPTNQPMEIEWVVTRGKWTLPDYSWQGAKFHRLPAGLYPVRTITLPELTALEGGARVSLDKMKLQVRDFNNTNLAGRMNGLHFMHVIPPYTQRQMLPVKVENAPAGGARCELYMPRLWDSCWGGQ